MVTAAPPSEVAGSLRSDDDKGGDPLRRSQHWCIDLGSFSLTISYRLSPPMPTRERKPHLAKRLVALARGHRRAGSRPNPGSSRALRWRRRALVPPPSPVALPVR